jgi:hypothetical protein
MAQEGAAPQSSRSRGCDCWARRLDNPGDLEIPIGPTGELIGAAIRDEGNANPPVQRDDLGMWSLTDPQRATRIVLDTSEFYVRQLLVRAVAAGESVAIHSNRPDQWLPLAQTNVAVMQWGCTLDFVPSIVVDDQPGASPSAGLSSTVITLGRSETHRPVPDLRFVQTSIRPYGQLRQADHRPGDRGVPPRAGLDEVKEDRQYGLM